MTPVPLNLIANFLMKREVDVCPNSKRETQDNNLLAFIAARLMWKHSPKRTKKIRSLKFKTYLVFVKVCQIVEKMSCLYTQIRSRLSVITNNYWKTMKKITKNYLAGNKAFWLSSQTDDSHFANNFFIKIRVT